MAESSLVRHLRFRDLSYLATLGTSRSIHRAAALHGVSQPALSKTLRELEGVLGFAIFERSRRGVTPTKLGEIVVAQAVQMVANLDALSSRLEAERRGHGRVHRIGATPNPALRLIPAAFVMARAKFPNLVVEVVEGTTDDLLLALARGEYALVVGRSSPQTGRAAVKQTPLYPESGVIVGRAGHPAGGRRHRKLDGLLAFPWILPQHGPTRAAIDQAFMRAGCNPPTPSLINYATQLVCDTLTRSDALAVMPLGAVQPMLQSGAIVVVGTAADFQLPAYAMYRPHPSVSDPALDCLERSILEVAASLDEVRQRPTRRSARAGR